MITGIREIPDFIVLCDCFHKNKKIWYTIRVKGWSR